MTYYIENEALKIGVKSFGCELTSVYSKENGYEYLWQGDEKYWSGQSPILFPIVGRLIDDKYLLDGKEYSIPKHGFARKTEWALAEKTENSISFSLEDTEETLLMYPYKFKVTVTFSIKENKLSVEHKIDNLNSYTMYCSLGAHPAFNCEIGDVLSFDENETLSTEKIDLINSLRLPETLPVLNNEKDIVITDDIFNEDALILHGIKSEHITLRSNNHTRTIRFNLGKAPYLGIWSKPGAPYVCIEPWCGVNDSTEKKADFSLKDGINPIKPNDSFVYTWQAEFNA